MTHYRVDTIGATLDDAQRALIEALARMCCPGSISGGFEVADVEDAGADRHERLVGFTLIAEDGTSTTYTATIREEDNS